MVQLLILTGQRRGQFQHLRGEWVDRKQRLITWPPQAMKAGREHTIPYGDAVADILAGLPDIGLLFPTNYRGGIYKERLDSLIQLPRWTLHDSRRSFATHIAELGIQPHVIERILAHSSGTISGIAAVYNRATYVAEMRDAFQKWEATLHSLLQNYGG
jgi:integrase